jgi:hypothetical protein
MGVGPCEQTHDSNNDTGDPSRREGRHTASFKLPGRAIAFKSIEINNLNVLRVPYSTTKRVSLRIFSDCESVTYITSASDRSRLASHVNGTANT